MQSPPAPPITTNAAEPAGMPDRPPLSMRQGGPLSSNREIAVVQADYLALANDLEQAQSLASALELQLSGKTNELARFKVIWERTQADLLKFSQDLDTMRKERHALANDAQRGYAFKHKFEKLEVAHEELTKKVERLESELARERSAHMQSRAELEQAQKLREVAAPVSRSVTRGTDDPELRGAIEALRKQLDRVLASGESSIRPIAKPAPERIDIEFGT